MEQLVSNIHFLLFGNIRYAAIAQSGISNLISSKTAVIANAWSKMFSNNLVALRIAEKAVASISLTLSSDVEASSWTSLA